jgi:hypothetical protein
MDLYWSIERGRLVAGIRSTVEIGELKFKRRDGASLRLYFVRDDGSFAERPSTTEIRFAIKRPRDFTGPLLAFDAGFVQQSDLSWEASPNLNTEQMDAFFTPPNVESKTAMAEITFRDSETGSWTSSQTLTVIIENDLIQGDEGTPTNAEEPTSYLTAAQSEARYVRYDAAQSLSSEQQSQGRSNLGAAAESHNHTTADLPLATSEEALAGESAETLMTPALVAEVLDQYSEALTAAQLVRVASASRLSDGVDDSPTTVIELELPAGTWLIKCAVHVQKTVGSETLARAFNLALNATGADSVIGSCYTERVALDILRTAPVSSAINSNLSGVFTVGHAEFIASIELSETTTVALTLAPVVTGTSTVNGSTVAVLCHLTANSLPA